jgi:hypothetical protein
MVAKQDIDVTVNKAILQKDMLLEEVSGKK